MVELDETYWRQFQRKWPANSRRLKAAIVFLLNVELARSLQLVFLLPQVCSVLLQFNKFSMYFYL